MSVLSDTYKIKLSKLFVNVKNQSNIFSGLPASNCHLSFLEYYKASSLSLFSRIAGSPITEIAAT